MEKYFITFRSVTFAQKGQRILEAGGMTCYLQRTPRWMESRGCGYALEVRDGSRAAELLRAKGGVFQKIYRLQKDRKPEEVVL